MKEVRGSTKACLPKRIYPVSCLPPFSRFGIFGLVPHCALSFWTCNNENVKLAIHFWFYSPAGKSKENDELKQTVGAIFVALLAAEFFLTPVLKPILLAAKDSPWKIKARVLRQWSSYEWSTTTINKPTPFLLHECTAHQLYYRSLKERNRTSPKLWKKPLIWNTL